ncbi:MAG: hypothetical protein K6F98_07525 [Bacteroidales bacterium]|nr:hypothetical protein [Bacteroidales bacterium]
MLFRSITSRPDIWRNRTMTSMVARNGYSRPSMAMVSTAVETDSVHRQYRGIVRPLGVRARSMPPWYPTEKALKIYRAGRWNRELASLKHPDSGRSRHDYFLRTFSDGIHGAWSAPEGTSGAGSTGSSLQRAYNSVTISTPAA